MTTYSHSKSLTDVLVCITCNNVDVVVLLSYLFG